MIYVYVFSWIEKLFFHRLHILDFRMLFPQKLEIKERKIV